MKTYIATARTSKGMDLRYEVEADNKKNANWLARHRAFQDGHKGVTSFRSVEVLAEAEKPEKEGSGGTDAA